MGKLHLPSRNLGRKERGKCLTLGKRRLYA